MRVTVCLIIGTFLAMTMLLTLLVNSYLPNCNLPSSLLVRV